MSAVGVVDGVATTRFDFRTTSLGMGEGFIDANGLRGTRARSIERNLQGNRVIAGSIRMQPTALEMASLLEWMMWGTVAGTSYPLGEAAKLRSVVTDRVIKVDTVATAAVNGWTLSGSSNQALDLELRVVGLDQTEGNAGTFPALTLDTTTFPFKFTDCVITANSGTHQLTDFSLKCEHMIDTGRFFNSQTLTGIYARDRVITFEANFPDGDSHSLYGLGRAGFAVVITATSGATSLVLTMANVAAPRRSADVPERAEILLPISGQAFKSGTSTLELTCVLDSTP
jgi:hypothetical protein